MNQNIFTIGEIELCHGVGDLSSAKLCVMAGAAAIHAVNQGTPLKQATDVLDCACPVVRSLVISRNDGFPDNPEGDKERTAWGRRLIPRIIGSRDDSKTKERWNRLIDVKMRVIFPKLYRNEVFKGKFTEVCDKLEAMPPLSSEFEIQEAKKIIRITLKERYAYYYADAYADAYYYANAEANAEAYAEANAYAKKVFFFEWDKLIEEFLPPCSKVKVEEQLSVPIQSLVEA